MQAHLDRGDAFGWFDALYQQSAGNPDGIPWADLQPNPNLVEWLDREAVQGRGRKALVVGCGLGDDAEYLAAAGFDVAAFDISSTAIDWSRQRFPDSAVRYCVVDLFAPPDAWLGGFDFVLEAYTLQTLPPDLRADATATISKFLAPGGTLLIVSRGRDPSESEGEMPWPLTREEINLFADSGLKLAGFEDYIEQEHKPVRRFRAVFRAPSR